MEAFKQRFNIRTEDLVLKKNACYPFLKHCHFFLPQTVTHAAAPLCVTHEPEHVSTSANNSPDVKHEPKASQIQYMKNLQWTSFGQATFAEIRFNSE